MSGGDGINFILEYTDRRMWVPTATSLRARRLRPPFPEAQSGQSLSVAGSPRACLTGGPSLCPGSMGEVGGATGSKISSARANHRVEK
jgi:hypothetical protein